MAVKTPPVVIWIKLYFTSVSPVSTKNMLIADVKSTRSVIALRLLKIILVGTYETATAAITTRHTKPRLKKFFARNTVTIKTNVMTSFVLGSRRCKKESAGKY